jgi:hypothetical protein
MDMLEALLYHGVTITRMERIEKLSRFIIEGTKDTWTVQGEGNCSTSAVKDLVQKARRYGYIE